MLIADTVDWTVVIDTALGVVQVVLVAIIGLLTRRHLRTPSGPTVGRQVEQANALSALAIGYLVLMMKRQNIVPPPADQVVANAEQTAAPIIAGEPLPRPHSG